MNASRFVSAMLCVVLCDHAIAQSQDMDKELSTLAESVATQIKNHGTKKVAILDFTDLQGGANELGKYVAEQMTVDLVMGKRDFSVLDRANLKSIMAEHKLTAAGLVDPDTAKKIGMFTGVDALILGTITPKLQTVTVTAKIITTDTAEVVGAARAEFKDSADVQVLLSRTNAAETSDSAKAQPPKPDDGKVSKTFGNLNIEVESLRGIEGGYYFLLTLQMTNQSTATSTGIALQEVGGILSGSLTDQDGNGFNSPMESVSGVVVADYNGRGGAKMSGRVPNHVTEIMPGESISVTIKFKANTYYPYGRGIAKPGNCQLQLDITTGDIDNGRLTSPTERNLLLDIKAK